MMRPFFAARNLLSKLSYHQGRSFSNNADQNQVTKYFCRAKLIDSIRLNMRSGSPDSLHALLKNPDLDSFVVTNALRSAPSPESALSFVESLKRVPNFVHTQHTLHAIAKTLAKAGHSAQLKKLIDAINDGEFTGVSPVSFVDCMRLYATAGDLELVLGVWDELRCSRDKLPCVESFNIVMSLYVRMGKDLEAVKTFCSLLQGGVLPNVRTFTIVIEHLVKSGNVEKAKEVFDVLPLMRVKHTIWQYSILLEAFLKIDRYDVVKNILKEMKMEGIMPPRSLLKSLQDAREVGYLEEVDDFVKEMEPDDRIKKIELWEDLNTDENEEDLDDCSSDNVTVQLKPWLDPSALASALRHWRPSFVSALAEAKIVWTGRLVCKMIRHLKKPETVWQFFCWVADQPDFRHDVYTYSEALKKLSSHGRVNLVDELLLKVKSEGIQLHTSTIRQIIDFYGLYKEGDAALKVFHDVKLLCGPCSDSDMLPLYSSLLQALLRCGKESDCMHIVVQMSSLGMHLDSQTFSGLMHNFALKGDFETVQKLYVMVRQCGIQPDAYMLTLIRAYCKCGRATLALRFLEDMRNSGLLPDAATKSLLVNSLWKEGRLKEASVVERTCEVTVDSLPLPSSSQMFNIKSSDLMRVKKLYCESFQGVTV